MRLTSIDIQNAIGCRRFAAPITAPVVVLAGPNGAGKTSIIESVRFALTGDMPRVDLKKEAGALVSEGAKTGHIGVMWEGGEAVVALPDCKLVTGKSGDIHAAMPFLTDMHVFANVAPNDRRSFLFNLTGVSASGTEVAQRLLDRKADQKKVDAVVPLLRSGFPEAAKYAATKATEAKGAWRAVTGETYGAKKADTWKAEAGLNVDANAESSARAQLGLLDEDLQAENQKLGKLQASISAAAEKAKRSGELREKADKKARIVAKLEKDRAERDELKAKVETTKQKAHAVKDTSTVCSCPECGAELIFGQGRLVPRGDLRGDENAQVDLAKYEQALTIMENSVKNGERDLAAANEAAAALAEIEEDAAQVSTDEIDACKARILEIRKNIEAGRARLDDIRSEMRKAAESDSKTKKAAEHHADVRGWDLIADALAPDGIPGELLAKALKPVNDMLAQSAADTGWAQVTIDADMAIRAGGRPYALLSESEQWRTDAMLTAAIAQLSGVKLAMFDRFDVLDLEGRAEALGWFDVMADNGELETLIVAGTLKALPKLPERFQAFWVEGGRVQAPAAAEAVS